MSKLSYMEIRKRCLKPKHGHWYTRNVTHYISTFIIYLLHNHPPKNWHLLLVMMAGLIYSFYLIWRWFQ